MKKSAMSDEQRKALLASAGLPTDGASLSLPAKPKRDKPKADNGTTIALAPEGVDPSTMPVSDIVFDPRLLDDFPSLSGEGFAAASRYVFSLYKSQGKNKDRNSLLHQRIGQFINQVRRSRETGTGYVKDKVKANKEQYDLAAMLAAKGITAADLAALLEK